MCESTDCHCHQAGGAAGGGHAKPSDGQHTRSKYPPVAGSTKERVARPVVDAKGRRPRAPGLRVRPNVAANDADTSSRLRPSRWSGKANRPCRTRWPGPRRPPEPPAFTAGAGHGRTFKGVRTLLRLEGQRPRPLPLMPEWKSNFRRAPRHRRDVVPVAASARWRGGSRRNLTHWLISTQVHASMASSASISLSQARISRSSSSMSAASSSGVRWKSGS